MGYTEENGWISQCRDEDLAPGRVWDFCNEELNTSIENKSGRIEA